MGSARHCRMVLTAAVMKKDEPRVNDEFSSSLGDCVAESITKITQKDKHS